MWGSMLNTEQYNQLKAYRDKLLKFKATGEARFKPHEINQLNEWRGLWTTWGRKDMCCSGSLEALLKDMTGLLLEYEENNIAEKKREGQ